LDVEWEEGVELQMVPLEVWRYRVVWLFRRAMEANLEMSRLAEVKKW
jgi:hypothetical protein